MVKKTDQHLRTIRTGRRTGGLVKRQNKLDLFLFVVQVKRKHRICFKDICQHSTQHAFQPRSPLWFLPKMVLTRDILKVECRGGCNLPQKKLLIVTFPRPGPVFLETIAPPLTFWKLSPPPGKWANSKYLPIYELLSHICTKMEIYECWKKVAHAHP